MNALIDELDRLVSQKRPDLYAALRAGVAAGDLDKVEQTIGKRLPALFRELYLWRDGQALDCMDNFQTSPGVMFMSLEWVMSTWTDHNELLECGDLDEGVWSTVWLPFMTDGSGNHLCIDLGAGAESPIIQHNHEEPDGEKLAPNFEHWLRLVMNEYRTLDRT